MMKRVSASVFFLLTIAMASVADAQSTPPAALTEPVVEAPKMPERHKLILGRLRAEQDQISAEHALEMLKAEKSLTAIAAKHQAKVLELRKAIFEAAKESDPIVDLKDGWLPDPDLGIWAKEAVKK